MYKSTACLLRLSIITFSILFISQAIYSQELNAPDALTAVLSTKENEMFSIITDGDKKEAEKLIAWDYVTIKADGVMEGKENTLETIGKFKGAVAKLSDKKIRVSGNIAIINSKAKFYLKLIVVAEIFTPNFGNKGMVNGSL